MQPSRGGDPYSPLSTICLRVAVASALAGALLGLGMGMTGEFRLTTAHAHLNLLGWVSMFLYGLFYRNEPVSPWAAVHVGVATLGLVLFVPSLALLMTGTSDTRALAEMGLKSGGALIVVGMLIFAGLVFRATGRRPLAPPFGSTRPL